jgi:hypothetical protein
VRFFYWTCALISMTGVAWGYHDPTVQYFSIRGMMLISTVLAPLAVLCLVGFFHSIRIGRTEARGVVLIRESQPRAFAFIVWLYFVTGSSFALLLVIGWIRYLV